MAGRAVDAAPVAAVSAPKPAFELHRLTKDTLESHLPAVKALFLEYTRGLLDVGCDVNLFQGFDAELAALPGKYALDAGGCMIVAVAPSTSTVAATTATSAKPDTAAASATVDASSAARDEVGAGGGAASPGDEESKLHSAPAESGFVLPSGERACACIALRKLDDATCEIKRLYVRPAGRGNRLGTRLTAQLLDIAYREFGYKRAVLDTLERLPAAIRLYNSLGFDRIEAYCYNPLHDVVYMGCALPWTAPSTQEAAEGASKAADA